MNFREISASYFNIILIITPIVNNLPGAYASICTGNAASPNWYGSVGYPPYFIRNSAEKCPQKYSLSRCEQSAVMMDGSSNFTTNDSGSEICNPNIDCYPTKQNCNDTLVCSDLVKLKDELMEGGHNIVCRHEKTYWQQYTGENKNCHLNKNCLDSEVKKTQRQLQPNGWRSAKNFATSFREMGIPIGQTFSSPFTRCAEHAEIFSNDEPNKELLELMYMSPWEEILDLNNITEKIKLNALKWQTYNLRNFAGKKPPPGKNNIIVTHGFNIKLSFGTAVDEGYCMVLKPEDSEESLADSIGSLTVANKVFTFANDSFPVNAIARMSPESALLMQTCDDVRSDAINNTEDVLSSIDVDHDMKITKEEFFSAHGNLSNSEEALDFILSVVTQPEILGKPSNELPSIELGQFFHINWGWREFLKTEGDIAYPWRSILENTIGPLGNNSPTSRVTAFKRANAILSNLIIELRNQIKYPSKVEMEEKLLNCETNYIYSQQISDCADRVFLADSGGSSYIPVGAGDGNAASMSGESIFETPLAYPSNYKPGSDFFESKLLKVANCLINHEGSLSLPDLGCESLQTPAPTNAPTMSCAVEEEKSAQCGANDEEAKEKCCPGLVCHEYQWWRCVKEENKYCAGTNTLATECGSKWKKATPQCCPGLVCGADRRCVLPPSGLFQSSSHTSSSLPTSSPTILSTYPTSTPTSLSFNDVRYRIGNNN